MGSAYAESRNTSDNGSVVRGGEGVIGRPNDALRGLGGASNVVSSRHLRFLVFEDKIVVSVLDAGERAMRERK